MVGNISLEGEVWNTPSLERRAQGRIGLVALATVSNGAGSARNEGPVRQIHAISSGEVATLNQQFDRL